MKKIVLTLLLVLFIIPFLISPVHAYLVFQNGFETGVSLPGTERTLIAGEASADDITDWTVTAGNINWVKTTWTPQEGSYSIDLSGNTAGTIQTTTFATTLGTQYTVSFWLSGNFYNNINLTDKTVFASVNGIENSFSFPHFADWSLTNMGWTEKTFTFEGNGADMSLILRSGMGGSNYGPAIDNVSITAPNPVPIPAAIWLLGSGLIGLVGLRRKFRK